MQNVNNYSVRTIKNLIEISAEKFKGQPAVSFVNENPLTYQEFGKKIRQAATYLQSIGIKKTDKIAILGENSPNWGVAYMAISSIGAIIVPILPDFQAKEINNILEHSESKVLFVSEKLLKNVPESFTNSDKHIIYLNDFKVKKASTGSEQTDPEKYSSIYELLNDEQNYEEIDVNEDDIATIIYTSGTTGTSKGVMLTHKNIISNVYSSTKIQDIGINDRFLSILPLSHTYENTLGFLFPIIKGSSIYYLGQVPTATALISAMQKIKPTLILSVPLIIEKIYRAQIHKKFTGNSVIRLFYKNPAIKKFLHKLAGKKLMQTFGGELKFFGVGGAAISPDVEQFLIDAKFPYAIGYGLTETSPLLAGANPKNSKYRSTGPAVDQVEIKIDNPDQNGEGEILARGPNIMKGYYKNEEETAKVFSDDGWFKTGDLGMLDEDNFLYIKGRLKNMILGPSGENIYPEEIEAIINKYKYVTESLVFEEEGKLIAKVHLNFEELEEHFKHLKESATTQMQEKINEIIDDIHTMVNMEVSKFSRLKLVMVQTEPFEKTPTKKIKRYLYI